MRLTTKGRFAVSAMLDLALHQGDLPVNLAEISKRQDISLSYLEQLFGKLRRANLVYSLRGPGGGYFLNHPDSEISVLAIIAAVDDDLDATQCHGEESCTHSSACLTHHLWTNLNSLITGYLSTTTLASLVAEHKNRLVQEEPINKNINKSSNMEAKI